MTIPAIIMMVFGISVTWGGAAICFVIALKNPKEY